MSELLIFVTATLLSYLLLIYIKRGTRRWRLIDLPNERSSHVQPTPKGGGAAIALITLLGVGLFLALGSIFDSNVVIYLVAGGGYCAVGPGR